ALKLDLQVLAEGIETEEQRDYLGACGVDFMQGYFYARPMPVNDFLQTILQYPDFSKKAPWPGAQRPVAPCPAPAPQV
ncbi:cyclic diguanylate phosphodiesterase, partial [Pseudomonas simiae]